MGYDLYRLGGKPHKVIAKLNLKLFSQPQCTQPAIHMQMHWGMSYPPMDEIPKSPQGRTLSRMSKRPP